MTTVTVVGEVIVDQVYTHDGLAIVGGGSAANMALALARAGVSVSLRARFSQDKNGQFLRNVAIDNGVDVSDSIDAPEPATVVDVTLDAQGIPRYTFPLDPTADWQWTKEEISKPLPPDTKVVICGSLAAVLDPGARPQLDWVKEIQLANHNARIDSPKIRVFFDPNARPNALEQLHVVEKSKERIQEWISLADVVKVSQEDIEWLDPSEPPPSVAKAWSKLGPRLVVMTRGADGVAAYQDGEEIVTMPAPTVEVADTVGAGDTFMAWLARGYVEHEGRLFSDVAILKQVLNKAANAAAVNCSRVGCNPPRLVDLD